MFSVIITRMALAGKGWDSAQKNNLLFQEISHVTSISRDSHLLLRRYIPICNLDLQQW
jgi:hypothetical protein